jgi:hypothetical protein
MGWKISSHNHERRNKVLQNCQNRFTIEPDDFAFYEKVKVPPPTFCPDCRYYARLSFRNPRKLWHRSCMCGSVSSPRAKHTTVHFHGEGKCPNEFETSYPEEGKEIVYCEDCYNTEVV